MALAGFDESYYLSAKLATLQATYTEWAGKDTAFLKTVLQNSYNLTPEQHYQQYGYAEGLAPNAYFNADEYVLAKATSLFNAGGYISIDAAKSAFQAAWTGDVYLHYLQYGASEKINPSNSFDESDYLASKLAALQADAGTSADWTGKTTDDLRDYMLGLGITPLEHYIQYGASEGLSAPAVPVGEKVTVNTETTNPGQSYTLTTAADTGSAFTGTSGNDTFVSSLNTKDNVGSTYTAGDNLDGGTGTDTLTISVTGDGTLETFSAVNTTSIEKVSVSNFGTTTTKTATFDMAGATGLTTLGTSNSSATGHTAFTSVTNAVNAEMKGSGNLTITNSSGLLTGTADSATLTLSGTGSSTVAPTFKMWAGSSAGVVETLNIVTQTANSYLTLSGDNDHKTLNISGDKNLTLSGDLDTTTTKVDASGLTGGLTVSLDDISAKTSFALTGGSGNDVVILDGSKVDATKATITGGDGTDTLMFDVATNVTSATHGAAITGFENVVGYRSVTEAADTDTDLVVAQDVSLLGTAPTTVGVSTWSVTQTGAGSGAGSDSTYADGVTFTGLAAGTGLALSGIKATDASTGTNDDGLILGFTASASLKTNTTADSINVTLGTATAGMSSTATAGTLDANTAVNVTLTLNDYETVNLASQGGANTVAALNSTSLKTLNISGDKALTISGGTNASLKTIDASTATANVNVASLGKGSAVTITGGSGNDSLAGSTATDSLLGGAGNDTISGGGGNDIISGEAGNDSLVGGTGNDVITGGDGNDTITGAGGNDSIDGGAGNDKVLVTGNGHASLTGISSTTTIAGGDGTDVLSFASNASIDFTQITSSFNNVSSIEKYEFTGLNASQTITVNDVNVGAANGALTLLNAVNVATTWDASGVLSNSSKVVYEQASTVTAAQTYKAGNGMDQVTFGSGDDTFEVATVAYLSGNDTVVGGSGTADTVKFTEDSTTAVTITDAQLGALSGFEKITVDATANTNAKTYTVTLTDTFLANNNNVGAFTVERAATDTAAIKADGSAVTSAYQLTLTGSSGNDTLLGGAGNDILTPGAGKNSVDGGAGTDTIVVASSQSVGSVLNGGDGTDTLQISSTSNVDVSTSTVSGIEKIMMNGSGAEVTIAGSVLSGSSIAIYANAANENQIINVQAVGGGTTDLSSLKFDATSTGQSAATALWNGTGGGTDTIKVAGSALNDVIVASSSIDSITGGAGNDTIDLSTTVTGGATAGASDTVVFSAAASNGFDTITGFTVGATANGGDVLNVSGLGTLVGSGGTGGIGIGNAVYVGAVSTAKGVAATSKVVVIGATDNAAADWSNVAAKIEGALTIAGDTTAGNAATTVLISNGTDTRVYLFSDDANNNATVEAGELSLVGVLSNQATVASFVEANFAIA